MNKILRILKKRRSGGFTLVEMIVSVALLAILLGGMMLFIAPIVRSFNETKTNLTAENVSTTVQEYIIRSIRNANQVAVFNYVNENDLISGSAKMADGTSYSDVIKGMNTYCETINGTGTPDELKKYLLKCISLRYEDGKYVLYQEKVQMNAGGQLSSSGKVKVFSDCLYDDLYLTFDFGKIKNSDYGNADSKTSGYEYRPDTLTLAVNAYGDASHNNKLFVGSGVFELRQIKVMLDQDISNASDYYLKMAHENNDSTSYTYADSSDGHKDIFIYYTMRRLDSSPKPASTTPSMPDPSGTAEATP